MSKNKVLYNGAHDCHTANCCPVIEQEADGRVLIHDPAKPESGAFRMSVDELRLMLGKAEDIKTNLGA